MFVVLAAYKEQNQIPAITNSSEASSYYDKILVRKAFFYLVSEVGAGRWQYTNNMEPDEWYCKEAYHSTEDIDDVLDDQDA